MTSTELQAQKDCRHCGAANLLKATHCSACSGPLEFGGTWDDPSADAMPTGAKVVMFLGLLACWFFIGGFITLGPRLAHGIESKVGNDVLDWSFFVWLSLPFTLGFAIFKGVAARIIFAINFISWVGFLWYVHERWK